LQGHLGWNTKEMTTEELKRAFKKDLLLTKEQKQEILPILLDLDQVKFAKKSPPLQKQKGCMNGSKSSWIKWIAMEAMEKFKAFHF